MKKLLIALLLLAGPVLAQPMQVNTSSTLETVTVVNTAAAYAAANLNIDEGGLTFTKLLRQSPLSARVNQVIVSDLDATGKNLILILFCSNPSATTFTNAAALDVADSDISKICCRVSLDTHKAFADNAIITGQPNCTIQSSTGIIYGALLTTESTTWSTGSALTVTLAVSQD